MFTGIADGILKPLVLNKFDKKHNDNWLRSEVMAGFFMA